jgi:hypothetical protein
MSADNDEDKKQRHRRAITHRGKHQRRHAGVPSDDGTRASSHALVRTSCNAPHWNGILHGKTYAFQKTTWHSELLCCMSPIHGGHYWPEFDGERSRSDTRSHSAPQSPPI